MPIAWTAACMLCSVTVTSFVLYYAGATDVPAVREGHHGGLWLEGALSLGVWRRGHRGPAGNPLRLLVASRWPPRVG
eukprot:2335820-Rhodomonas_salina.2